MLRIVKILLVLSVAAYCLLGMIANVDDPPRTLGSIGAVVSMAAVEGGPGWQATHNPAVILGVAIFIVLFKTIAGVTCLIGAWRMWRERRADAEAFAHAKTLALVGCGVAMLGLHLGWTVFGEQLFDMWRSKLAQSANTAFRYGGFTALIAIFVGMSETDRVAR